MQYLVKNITPVSNQDGSYNGSKTIWVEGSVQGNCYPLGPQETVVVADTAIALLLKTYPEYVQVIDTFTDDDAPVAKVITPTSWWIKYSLAKFCTNFQFTTAATDVLVSFSGWNAAAGETAPATDYQIPIPAGTFDLNMTMNPTKEFYVKGSSGTLTVIAI